MTFRWPHFRFALNSAVHDQRNCRSKGNTKWLHLLHFALGLKTSTRSLLSAWDWQCATISCLCLLWFCVSLYWWGIFLSVVVLWTARPPYVSVVRTANSYIITTIFDKTTVKLEKYRWLYRTIKNVIQHLCKTYVMNASLHRICIGR